MILNKRAVSPLIATVLLVMIVVSIGAAVMVVIQGITQDQLRATKAQQQLITCATDVEVQLLDTATGYKVCLNRPNLTADVGNLAIYLENRGLTDISDWRLTIIGELNVTDENGGFVDLETGEIKKYDYNWTTSGVIEKIRISPKIPGGASNPLVTCIEPNLDWDADEITDWDTCESVSWDD